MLEENRLMTACGMKPAMKEQSKSPANVLVFVSLLLLGNAFAYFCLVPTQWRMGVVGMVGMLYLLILVLVCRDPGGPAHFPAAYLSADHSLLQLYLTNESHKVCPECVVLQPRRARHCTICRKCIFKYDHHCPWINNCIGARNICIFYVFLVLLWLDLALVLVGIGYSWAFQFQPVDYINESVVKTVSLVILLIDAGFIGPLSILTCVQTRNLTLNRTTHERFAYNSRDKSDSVSSNLSETNGGCLCNCLEMCCKTAVTNELPKPGKQVSDSGLDLPLLASTTATS